MNYGIRNYERAFGTVVEWEGETGFMQCEAFKDRMMVREKEILSPCGAFHVAIDGISRTPNIGDVYESTVIEDVNQGLMAIGNIPTGNNLGSSFVGKGSNVWEDPSFPRFIGVVKHWNHDKCFGFIDSDLIRVPIFFQKKVYLIPYEDTADPFKAISASPKAGDIVTFDVVETPRGHRALGIKNHQKGGEYGR